MSPHDGSADPPPGPRLPGTLRRAVRAGQLPAGVRLEPVRQQPGQPAAAPPGVCRRSGRHLGPRRKDRLGPQPSHPGQVQVPPHVPERAALRRRHRVLLDRVRAVRAGSGRERLPGGAGARTAPAEPGGRDPGPAQARGDRGHHDQRQVATGGQPRARIAPRWRGRPGPRYRRGAGHGGQSLVRPQPARLARCDGGPPGSARPVASAWKAPPVAGQPGTVPPGLDLQAGDGLGSP